MGDAAHRPPLDIGEIIDLVEGGDQYVIQRHGQPVAVVLSIAEYDSLQACAQVPDDG